MLTCLMSWEGRKSRWKKMYRGRMYYVSCTTLGAPPTKTASAALANAWWRRKRAEIDSTRQDHSTADVLEVIDLMRPGAPPLLAAALDDQVRWVTEQEEYPQSVRELLLYGVPLDVAVRVTHAEPITRLPSDETIGGQATGWLDLQMARSRAGEVSEAGATNQQHYLAPFLDWAGRERSIAEIDEAVWAGFHRFLLEQVGEGRWSRSYAAKLHRTARQFIDHMVTGGLIERPRNLDDRTMRFRITARTVEVFAVADVRRMLAAAGGQLRLHVLLGLNCGMTQVDIGDLHPSEVSLEAGTIRRKRSKTSEHEGVPVVTYPLWPETLALLRRYASTNPGHVLLTKTGRPWSKDSIGLAFRRLCKRLNDLPGSFKLLRKTSASRLESDDRYARHSLMFLGHSPRSIKDRHYVQPDPARFAEAVQWLRSCNFGPTPSDSTSQATT
jgi:integrase